MISIQDFLEKSVFGVCTSIADKIGISTSRVRLYFIYTSFLSFGSPIVFYLVLAWLKNIKRYVRRYSYWVLD